MIVALSAFMHMSSPIDGSGALHVQEVTDLPKCLQTRG